MRVQTVYQLLADALTNEEIIRFAAENWDVGRRQTENYIAEVNANCKARTVRSQGRPTWQRFCTVCERLSRQRPSGRSTR